VHRSLQPALPGAHRTSPEQKAAHLPAILRGAPETWLVIVGEGSLDAELHAQAAALPAQAGSRIIFTGRREDVAAITGEIDVALGLVTPVLA